MLGLGRNGRTGTSRRFWALASRGVSLPRRVWVTGAASILVPGFDHAERSALIRISALVAFAQARLRSYPAPFQSGSLCLRCG